MSAYAIATKRTNKTVEMKAPYCDICFKKGLPKEAYQSHYPKSNGVTTCPTILAAQCRYCGLSGHWANEKYCQAMRADNEEFARKEKRARRQEEVAEKKRTRVDAPVVNRITQNAFAGLQHDSDDEDAVVPTPVVIKKNLVKAPVVSSWSNVASLSIDKPAFLTPKRGFVNCSTSLGYTQLEMGKDYSSMYSDAPNEKEYEAMKILAERRSQGYFETDEEEW